METTSRQDETPLRRYRLEEDDQLVLIHVPKTAGTTLTRLVMRHFSEERVCPARHWDTMPEWRGMPGRKNLSEMDEDLAQYQYFTGHFRYDIGRLLPKKPIYITILRDPVERVMSLYKYICRQESHPLYDQVIEMSLQEFAAWDVPHKRGENKNRYVFDLGTRFDIKRPCDIKSVVPVCTDLETIAKKRLGGFAFVGLAERFNHSVLLLSYILHWEPILHFENYNVAPTPTSRDDLSREALETITENNQEDVRLYEYGKAIFERQWQQMVQAVFTG